MSSSDNPYLNPGPSMSATDPAALAGQLATGLNELEIGIIVCWYRVEDAVLAHAVARELEVPVCYAFDSEGLLSLAHSIDGKRVALVAVDFPFTNDLPGLSGVVRAAGGEILAVATGQPRVDLTGTAAESALNVGPGQ